MAAHLRSLSLRLCFSLRWLSDILVRALFFVLLPGSPAESGEALADFLRCELLVLPCGVAAASVKNIDKMDTDSCIYLSVSNKTL